MEIKGLQKLTLLDYPEKLACTVFLAGCNLRCPFCHNFSLVIPSGFGDSISHEEFFEFLKSRQHKLGGVCISGGEPTLHKELPEFIKEIKKLGYSVKLDTNGTSPDVLEALVKSHLIDYVAMDIKSSKEGYGRAVGCDVDIGKIEKSVEILMRGEVDFEFRTTVVRGIHTETDIIAIGEWLRGDEKYFLQSFVDSSDVPQKGLCAYSAAEMEQFKNILCKFVPLAQIRN